MARTPVATKNLASEEKFPTIVTVPLHGSEPLDLILVTLCPSNAKLNG